MVIFLCLGLGHHPVLGVPPVVRVVWVRFSNLVGAVIFFVCVAAWFRLDYIRMSSSKGFFGGLVDMSVPNVVVPDFEVLVSPRNPNLCISCGIAKLGISGLEGGAAIHEGKSSRLLELVSFVFQLNTQHTHPNSVQVLSLFLFHLLYDSSHTLGILILGQRSKSSVCTQNLSPLV
jgi:hypothetical protein